MPEPIETLPPTEALETVRTSMRRTVGGSARQRAHDRIAERERLRVHEELAQAGSAAVDSAARATERGRRLGEALEADARATMELQQEEAVPAPETEINDDEPLEPEGATGSTRRIRPLPEGLPLNIDGYTAEPTDSELGRARLEFNIIRNGYHTPSFLSRKTERGWYVWRFGDEVAAEEMDITTQALAQRPNWRAAVRAAINRANGTTRRRRR